MKTERKVEQIDKQIAASRHVGFADLTTWKRNNLVVLKLLLGEQSDLYVQMSNTTFALTYTKDLRDAVGILEAAKLEIVLTDELAGYVTSDDAADHASDGVAATKSSAPVVAQLPITHSDVVFIVHGHDDGRKYEAASFIESLTSKRPTILHEQPNKGRVVIEKFEAHASEAGFAIVLLTADDIGRAKADRDDRPRARQNVVLEMGFFIGSFGRDRIAVLHEDEVELPSDLAGIVYIPLDAGGAWKTKLARELAEAGITIDWSALGR